MTVKQWYILWLLMACGYACSESVEPVPPGPGDQFTRASHDGSLAAPFGSLDYRVFYPVEFSDSTHLIHVSRGGSGLGDDRSELLSYVDAYVQAGYVVLQLDHRFAGRDIEQIAQYRGEEISFAAQQVAAGQVDYGNFEGTVIPEAQGYAGHSGGCMEGLMAAGTGMSHGDYLAPEIKAVYGMSPAGDDPDQFGIEPPPGGFAQVCTTAIFVIVGEEEIDINGPGTFMAEGWRLQAYTNLNDDGPRYQAVVRGDDTDHSDVAGANPDIETYNIANSLALFATYLRQEGRAADIGNLSLPPANQVDFSQKGN